MSEAALAEANTPAPRKQVVSWAFYDWGSSAFNTVVVTFIFSVYLAAGPGKSTGDGPAWVSGAVAVSGVFIALLAPITGQRADAGGRRKLSVIVWSALTILAMIGMFFVKPERSYFMLGLFLFALAGVFASFADVSYSGMIRQISTPKTIGRVSAFGWAMGYFGGIFILAIALFGFVIEGTEGDGKAGLLGISEASALNIRMTVLVAAVWFVLFALPLVFFVPEHQPTADIKRASIIESYRILFRQLRELWRIDRNTIYFLAASALFRDGLAAVFTIGAIVAVDVYGLETQDVIMFGIVANVVSGLSLLVSGRIDDKIGPKAVILTSLIGLMSVALVLMFVSGPTMFWILGLILCLFVGPAQSSARTYLARLSPVGHEGQMFGLFYTTGRAVSFLAPALYSLFAGLFDAKIGIIGIVLVFAAGFAAMLFVRPPVDKALVADAPAEHS